MKVLKVLITGGTGFVGRHLIDHLSDDNSVSLRVTSRYNFREDLDPTVKLFNNLDLCNPTGWETAIAGVDVVVHTAGFVHKSDCPSHTSIDEIYNTNYYGTLRLANLAVQSGVTKFIYISSTGVYGPNHGDGFINTNVAPNPITHYAKSKLLAENGLVELARQSKMSLIIVRPPLIYGPDAPGLFGRILRIFDLPFYFSFGGLKTVRSFVSIYNLVDFISCCISNRSIQTDIFLVSDGERISLSEFIHRSAIAVNGAVKMITIPGPVWRLLSFLLPNSSFVSNLLNDCIIDNSKSSKLLGWTPPFTVGESLRMLAKDRRRKIVRPDRKGTRGRR